MSAYVVGIATDPGDRDSVLVDTVGPFDTAAAAHTFADSHPLLGRPIDGGNGQLLVLEPNSVTSPEEFHEDYLELYEMAASQRGGTTWDE